MKFFVLWACLACLLCSALGVNVSYLPRSCPAQSTSPISCLYGLTGLSGMSSLSGICTCTSRGDNYFANSNSACTLAGCQTNSMPPDAAGFPSFSSQTIFVSLYITQGTTLNATNSNGQPYYLCYVDKLTCSPAAVAAQLCDPIFTGMNYTEYGGYTSASNSTGICNSDLTLISATGVANLYTGYSLCNTTGCNTLAKMAQDAAIAVATATATQNAQAAAAAQMAQMQQQQQASNAANAAAQQVAAQKSASAPSFKHAATATIVVVSALFGASHLP